MNKQHVTRKHKVIEGTKNKNQCKIKCKCKKWRKFKM